MVRPSPFLAPDDAALRPAPRRGLSCRESANYIGVSETKFLEMVADGRMPKAKKIDGRRVYDIRRLDEAFDAIDGDEVMVDFAEHQPGGKRKIVL